MAFRSLGSLVRRGMHPRSCFSSPAIAVEEATGSAAASGEADRLRSLRNALFHSDSRKSPRNGSSLPGVVAQGFLGSPVGRRPRRRFHDLRDVVAEHADGAAATLCVVVFSAIAGVLHSMKDTDELDDEARKKDTPTNTPYLRSNKLMEEMVRERATYSKATPDDEKTAVREYMEEEDQAVRARFEEWMEAHGRTYKDDEVEKARRFKIFKSVARFTDAFNDDACKAGSSARCGLNEFSDWNAEELARLCGVSGWRDGGYFTMVLSYLALQEIWHQAGSNKEFED